MRGLKKMKILLPHREVNLDSSLNVQERKLFIDALLAESIEFHAQIMTVEEYLRFTWDKSKTKKIMDIVAYYLTKEEKDKSIMSKKKEEEMKRGTNSHTTFSSMGAENQEALGLIDSEVT